MESQNNFDENFIDPNGFIQPANDAQMVVSNIYANCTFGLSSRYNENYYCNITHVKINDADEIHVGIDMHGDSSLGKCQDPKTSSLSIYDEDSDQKVKLEFKDCKLTRDDKVYGFTGTLIYKCKARKGKFYFKFGKSGYTDAIFEISPEYDLLSESYPTKLESKYNSEYYCNIEYIKVYKDSIHIGIDMHGNMSLGPCQNPDTSRLFYRDENENKQVMINFIGSEYSRKNNKSGYTGILKYEFNGQKGDYIFKFGKSGFTDAIFEVNY